MTDYKNLKLIASSSPHIRSNESTRTIMMDVIIAMIPALIMSVFVFGFRALALTLVSVAACVFWEWGYRKLLKKPQSIGDLSAVVTGMPVVSKVVTVSGSGVIDPKNLECPIGTPITALFDACGGLKDETYKLIMGGPMMGLAQYNLDVTVGKGTGAMLAFAGDEEQYEENPQCIRCGKCVGVCPMRLEPVFMYKYLMKGDVDTWQNTLHGMDCIECGACAYTCPARLPLTHAFRMGKQKVNNARMAAKAKAEAEKAAAEKKEA